MSPGNSVGVSPPISGFFGDVPAIHAMNMMGFTSDGLGLHDFDDGQLYLRTELIPLATFPRLSANLVHGTTGKAPPEWRPSAVVSFPGFKLGIVGFSGPETAMGDLAPFVVAVALTAINNEAARLKKKNKVAAVVAFGSEGVFPGVVTDPAGPLADLADGSIDVDAFLGGSTDVQALGTRPNGALVSQNQERGVRFTRLRLLVDPAKKAVVYKTADWHKPWNAGVVPDAGIQAAIDGLNAQLVPILSTVIGQSSRAVPRADACGNPAGRTCESLVGDLTTDAMRQTYGTDFAIFNSGGLRADLTCPVADSSSDFCPAYTPPPYPITRGQVLAVLPFGNVVATVDVDGAELKAYLENSVSMMPSANGRFGQVSGLCLTYSISAPVGSRVTSAVRQAADGSCTGGPIDLTAVSAYSLAINDFMAQGGDGYPNVWSRVVTRGPADEVLADYLSANSPVAPAIQGRIGCTTGGVPACPVVVP